MSKNIEVHHGKETYSWEISKTDNNNNKATTEADVSCTVLHSTMKAGSAGWPWVLERPVLHSKLQVSGGYLGDLALERGGGVSVKSVPLRNAN